MVNASSRTRATWSRVEIAYTLGALHYVSAILMLAASFATNDFSWAITFTRYQGALFLVGYALWSVVLTGRVASGFVEGDRLRLCWRFLFAASILRLLSSVIIQLFTHESYLNPLYLLWPGWTKESGERIFNFGVHVGGPVQYAVLLAGIVTAVFVYRDLGLIKPLRASDHAMAAGLAAHAIVQLYSAWFWVSVEAAETSFGWWLGWATDPLLAAVMGAAIIMRRSSAKLRGGLIEMGWTALAGAVLFVTIGNVSLWAMGVDYIRWPYDSLTWLIWYMPAILFVAAPAYQLEAMEVAAGER